MPSLYALLSGQQALLKDKGASEWYLFADQKVIVGPSPTKEALLTSRKAEKLHVTEVNLTAPQPTKKQKNPPPVFRAFGVPNGTVVTSCSLNAVVCPGVGQPTKTYWYLFKYQPDDSKRPIPEMTGHELKGSGTRADIDPTTSQPEVLMSFSGKGNHEFQSITKGLYERGRLLNSPQHFAIVLDREIRSFPQIDYTDSSLANGISGGARITGLTSFGEAKNLALVLQTGALPVNFKQIERTDVSATLGKDSLHQALRAAIVGLIVVALFLILFYRFLGVVAVLGLGIYAAFLYGVILLLNVTLTLPGFAGMILTIGVAADANVVVFERIKEEVRAGKSVRAAIAAGYAKGFHTILDANMVTAITALVLFAVATAGVKGFALMLLIGTVISLVTAVAATRAMLGLLAGFRWFANPRFMGAHGAQTARWLQIDFMRKRYWWLAFSGVVILIGAVSLGVRGLNFGIDFKGGTQISFKTTTPHPISDVRKQFDNIGRGAEAVIQGRGSQVNGGYKDFQVRTKALTGNELTRIQGDLTQNVGAVSPGATTVSSSFGHQIARLAIIAV